VLTSPATESDGFRATIFPFKLHRFAAHSCGRGTFRSAGRKAALAKEELLTMEGQIDEILPDGRFGVRLDNDHRVIVYTAGKMRRFRIRSVVGDRVHVEMTPYDLSKGRLIFREKTPGAGPGGPRRGGFRRR
jgi:translation initiation factor IF-1